MAADGIHEPQIHERIRHVLEREPDAFVRALESGQYGRIRNARALLDKVDADDRFLACCRAVGALPDECRRAFLLRKVYGLGQQQVAEAMGIPAEAVEDLLASGMLRYRMELLRLQREGGQPADRERA
jgi:DNA-directed RNA polymerase specialized sigma24 family protein